MLQHESRALKVPGNMTAQFDLSVTLNENLSGDGSIDVSFESGIGPWPGLEDRFMQLINHFLNEDAIKTPLTPILLPSEKAQVLRWGQGESKPVREVCLHQMFEEQAHLRPGSIALYNNNCTMNMTYGELEQQSNKLAVELQRLGVEPNTFVGILTGEKTFEMYVAVLGVLKSGAAYVPMDAVIFPQE